MPTRCVFQGEALSWLAHSLALRRPNSYTIQTLSQLLCALLIYDDVDYVFYSNFLQINEQEYGNLSYEPFIAELHAYTGTLSVVKMPESFFITEKLVGPRFRSRNLVSSLAFCPQEYVDNAVVRFRDMPKRLIEDALDIMGPDKDYYIMPIDDQKLYRDWFLGTALWRIETQKEARQIANANGIIYVPGYHYFFNQDCESERKNIMNSSFEKLCDLEQVILKQHIPPGFTAKFTPLLAILLDTTPSFEMIPMTIVQMRRDYSELRKIARSFEENLRNASSYREVSEIHVEWEQLWQNVFNRIGWKSIAQSASRIVTWETFSGLSIRSAAGKAAVKLAGKRSESKLRQTLSVFLDIEDEFLRSRIFQTNFDRLFPIQNSP